MKENIFNIEEIKKNYIFYFDDNQGNNIYFCSCGQKFKKEKEPIVPDDISKEDVDYLYSKDSTAIDADDDYTADLRAIFKGVEITLHDQVKCPFCNKNLLHPEIQKKIKITGEIFACSYEEEETEDNLYLYFSEIMASEEPLIFVGNEVDIPGDNFIRHDINFKENIKYLKLEKKTKKLFIGANSVDTEEIDLDTVIEKVESFFSASDGQDIYNIISLHLYINNLAKNVIDVQNIDIINELLSLIKNKVNDAGIGVIKKIVSIFFGIIKYSNLSTIAMTKSCSFLYEMMKECTMPKPSVLIENNVTAPIKIFNFLIKNYIEELNKDINEDNKDAHEFVYKSSIKMRAEKFINEAGIEEEKDFIVEDDGVQREMTIKIHEEHKDYKERVVKHNGKYKILEFSEDAGASKFIFKTIRNFNDFKQLIKYFKFFDKQQIITLITKYDLDLLVNLVDIIYFRDGIDLDEMARLVPIITSYVEEKTLEDKPLLNKDGMKLNYKYAVDFPFEYYDDSVMMMEVLKFDRRKDFNKIKTFKELMDYHNNIVNYFNTATDVEKNEKFRNFVAKFEYLEKKEIYKGPLDIILIKSPRMLIKEGVVMKHSASSYSRIVINETYLIGQVYDRTPGLPDGELIRFTVGFNYNKTVGLEFDQVKGFANQQGSDRFKKLLMEWLTTMDISFKQIKDLKFRNEQ